MTTAVGLFQVRSLEPGFGIVRMGLCAGLAVLGHRACSSRARRLVLEFRRRRARRAAPRSARGGGQRPRQRRAAARSAPCRKACCAARSCATASITIRCCGRSSPRTGGCSASASGRRRSLSVTRHTFRPDAPAGPGHLSVNVSDFDFDLPDELIAQEPPAERGGSRLMALDRATRRASRIASSAICRRCCAPAICWWSTTRACFRRGCSGRGCPAAAPPNVSWFGRDGRARTPGSRWCIPASGCAKDRGWSSSAARVDSRRDCSAATFTAGGPCGCGPTTARRCATRSMRSATCRCRRTSSAPDAIERSRSLSDRLRARARLDRGADGGPAFHAGDPRRAARHAASSAPASRCMSATERSSRFASSSVEEHQMEAEHYEVSRRGRRALIAGAGAKGGASSRSARRRRARSNRSPSRRTATVSPGAGETALFIRPGHRFRLVSGLITNFHLPQSSLLMLVSAFAGREPILAAYRDAVAQPLSVL